MLSVSPITSITNAGGAIIGKSYTITLSQMELTDLLDSEVFLRHSGRIRLVIAQDQVFDTSGNPNNETILTVNEFLADTNITVKPIADYNVGNIDSEFLVTYTSGSTNEHRPKAMIHTNRSLITMGRFQDPDLSGVPEMHDLVGLMLIPNHSNTSIITSMSDVLYKGCTVAIEPIYDENFLLHSFEINKPNYAAVARQMLVYAMKQLYSNPKFKDFKMEQMLMLTSVGEPTSKGEEKFINRMLRKARCGVGKLFVPVPVSIGGGDCERGGMFFTSYRRLRDFLPQYALKGERCGLKPYAMVETAILDENGNELPYGEIGRLVIKTPTTMKCYKNNPEATSKFYITDAEGRQWTDGAVYASMEKGGTLKIFERIGKEVVLDDGKKIPLFIVGNLVEKNENILSYEVVNVNNEFVVHLEMQPGCSDSENDINSVLEEIQQNIILVLGEEVASKVSYRVRSFEEGFPLSKCGKRSYPALHSEGNSGKSIAINLKAKLLSLVWWTK
mgnify:CR=1 FL=1